MNYYMMLLYLYSLDQSRDVQLTNKINLQMIRENHQIYFHGVLKLGNKIEQIKSSPRNYINFM